MAACSAGESVAVQVGTGVRVGGSGLSSLQAASASANNSMIQMLSIFT